jgi:hypothetical protein
LSLQAAAVLGERKVDMAAQVAVVRAGFVLQLG